MISRAAPEFRGVSWFRLWTGMAGAAFAAAAAMSMATPSDAAGLVAWTQPNPAAFDLPPLDAPPGATFSLSSQAGDAILVHFFASWCEPCREELPALHRLAERAAPRLKVVGIAVADTDSRLRRLLAETGVTFPVLLDRDRVVTRAWSVSALPSTVVLDASRRARLVVESDFAWDSIEPKQLLDQLSRPGNSASQQQSSVTQGGH